MKSKTRILILALLLIKCIAVAQTPEIDSLENLLANHPETDTVKIKLLNDIAFKVRFYDWDKTLQYATLADSLSDISGYQKGKAISLKIQGIYYNNLSDYPRTLDCYQKSLKISEAINDRLTMAACYNNIGNLNKNQGDYPRALENYQKTLSLFEKIGNKYYVAVCQINIGVLHGHLGNTEEELSCYLNAADYFNKIQDNRTLITVYQNIVSTYITDGNDSLALHYTQKLIPLCETMKDTEKITLALINYGVIEENFGNYDLAKQNYLKAISISEKIKFERGSYGAYYSLANMYYKHGAYNLALNNELIAYKITDKFGRLYEKSDNAELLSLIYKKLNNYKKAYDYYVVFKNITDSMFNESNIKKITNLENQYKFEKEKEAITAEQDRKDALQAEELKRQKIVRNSFIAGFIFMIVLSIVILWNLSLKRKANRELASQKEEIKNQAEELKTTNGKLVELDQFKQGLTSMIVHDLKNPLNGMLNVSKSYSAENQVRQMKQISKQMLNMVLNILDVNKYEENKMTIEKIAVSLAAISQQAINSILFLVEQKNITIINEIKSSLKVYADFEIIERVFVNILTNAVKYTPNNGRIMLNATMAETHDFVKVNVTDTGSGIPLDKINLVFVKFGQVAAKTSGSVRSTGLGLTFCKMAVEAHGGEINLESEIDKGSTFWFTLQSAHHEIVREYQAPVLITNQEKYSLNKKEKEMLAPLINQMKKTEIYKMFELRKFLRQVTNESDNIKKWKNEIQNAIRSGNQERYNELLKI